MNRSSYNITDIFNVNWKDASICFNLCKFVFPRTIATFLKRIFVKINIFSNLLRYINFLTPNMGLTC